MDSEGGTAIRQLSTEVRDRTISAVGDLQSGQPACIESHTNIVSKVLSRMKEKAAPPREPFGNLMTSLSCLIAFIVAPSFFYFHLINVDKKCIAFDKKVGIIGCMVLTSISEILCLIYVTIPLWHFSARRRLRKFLWFLFFILCNLPLQQVLIILVFARRITSMGNDFATIIIMVQLTLRAVLMLIFITVHTFRSGSSAGRLTFILLYPCLAHLFGAFWYQMAIFQMASCWEKDCVLMRCRIRQCDESLDNYLKNSAISCDLGLCKDISKYNFWEVTDFGRKLLFGLRWGFQTLSCFGVNLQPNDTIIQNIFAITISIAGIALFLIYVVFLQRWVVSALEREDKPKQKIEQIKNSRLFTMLSENLQSQVMQGKRHSIQLEMTGAKAINVVNFLGNLSEDLTKEIKRELCLEMLKKVEQFGRWSEALLKELCECMKPVAYAECTYIVRDRESIDKVLFLVQGKLQTYSFRSVHIGSTRTARRRSITCILEEGEFCGEELIAWFQADLYACNLPISARSATTVTKVDGFILSADDLKATLMKHHNAVSTVQAYWRFRRRRKAVFNAVFIQTYWRFRMIMRKKHGKAMMKKHHTVEGETSTQDQTPSMESDPPLLQIFVQP